jgi:glycosyltransferase involved in cell wall biosynthesis
LSPSDRARERDWWHEGDPHGELFCSAWTDWGRANPRTPARPTVAVAIPTYLREAVLVETIEQVLRQAISADEVLIVDQSPAHEEETLAWLGAQADAGRIRWIRTSRANLPAARNLALRETRCDIVIFIDDDVVLAPGFIEAHVRNYEDPAVQAVAGRTLQPRGWNWPQRQEPWRPIMDHRYFPLDSERRRERIANFPGGNHSVRRRSMLALGGYDENYAGWAFREDSDAAIRLWKSGANIVFDPDASLVHLATPAGGCRLRGPRSSTPEWAVSFPANYFAFRHLRRQREFWQDILFTNVRKYVLRKSNVLAPWRLPWAVLSYGFSLAAACHRSRQRLEGRG